MRWRLSLLPRIAQLANDIGMDSNSAMFYGNNFRDLYTAVSYSEIAEIIYRAVISSLNELRGNAHNPSITNREKAWAALTIGHLFARVIEEIQPFGLLRHSLVSDDQWQSCYELFVQMTQDPDPPTN